MKTIGTNIRKIRELKNLRQAYMADQLKISQSEYSRIENGHVKLDAEMLKNIAPILEVKVQILYNFDESKSLDVE